MALDAVYGCLKMQNRPYNVNDVTANLHNEYSKVVIQNAMDQLVTQGKLFVKTYGKQKIYCIVQTSTDADDLIRASKELQVHADEIENKYQEIMKKIKENESLLSFLKSSPSLEEAEKEKIILQESINQLMCKLNKLKEMNVSEDLFKSKRKVEQELNENSHKYQKRKRICTEIVDCILENYPGSKTGLYEEIGIDSTIV